MKSEAEINAEKNAKPRIDIVPPALMLAAGRALGYGAEKHGVPEGNDGFGTWRTPNTQQADPLTHYACLMRHLLLWRSGEVIDPVERGGSGLPHLDHAAAQLAILLDLLETRTAAAEQPAAPPPTPPAAPHADPEATTHLGPCLSTEDLAAIEETKHLPKGWVIQRHPDDLDKWRAVNFSAPRRVVVCNWPLKASPPAYVRVGIPGHMHVRELEGDDEHQAAEVVLRLMGSPHAKPPAAAEPPLPSGWRWGVDCDDTHLAQQVVDDRVVCELVFYPDLGKVVSARDYKAKILPYYIRDELHDSEREVAAAVLRRNGVTP